MSNTGSVAYAKGKVLRTTTPTQISKLATGNVKSWTNYILNTIRNFVPVLKLTFYNLLGTE